MKCYLCGATTFFKRKGRVRDAPQIKVIECKSCGLVSLSSLRHINSRFYEKSQMHGSDLISMETWLKESEVDDSRRLKALKPYILSRHILDFGCGAGGCLYLAKPFAESVTGIEAEARVQSFWQGQIAIWNDIPLTRMRYDLITAFHVMEHLPDPRATLVRLSSLLEHSGRLILEVPNSEDALLTLYDCDAFQHFSYWSPHLFLFNSKTLELLVKQSGLKLIAIEHVQRYPLSNHLHWLSRGSPGGHRVWGFLDSPELVSAYSRSLGTIGMTDTIVAHVECP